MGWIKDLIFGKPEEKKNLRETDHQSHPCAGCKNTPSYRGHLCQDCQRRLNLWCPCGAVGNYEKGVIRESIPDYIVSENCNRCGYLIKDICDAMDRNDDNEVDRLITKMKEINDKR